MSSILTCFAIDTVLSLCLAGNMSESNLLLLAILAEEEYYVASRFVAFLLLVIDKSKWLTSLYAMMFLTIMVESSK